MITMQSRQNPSNIRFPNLKVQYRRWISSLFVILQYQIFIKELNYSYTINVSRKMIWNETYGNLSTIVGFAISILTYGFCSGLFSIAFRISSLSIALVPISLFFLYPQNSNIKQPAKMKRITRSKSTLILISFKDAKYPDSTPKILGKA